MSITPTKTGVRKHLEDIIKRGKTFPQWVTRNGTKLLAIEMNRIFEAVGPGWAPLQPAYAAYKKIKYGAYDGGGEHINIATDRLRKAVTFQNASDLYQIVGDDKWVVTTPIEYAKYVDEKRSFSANDKNFADRVEFQKRMRENYRNYFLKGRLDK